MTISELKLYKMEIFVTLNMYHIERMTNMEVCSFIVIHINDWLMFQIMDRQTFAFTNKH